MDSVPSFPSLYNPTIDLLVPGPDIPRLTRAEDIERFTLYWTVILYAPFYIIPGLWAFAVHVFPKRIWAGAHDGEDGRLRARATLAILMPLAFIAYGAAIALIGGTIVGHLLSALYAALEASMSTWVPFLWAATQVSVFVMGSYPWVIAII